MNGNFQNMGGPSPQQFNPQGGGMQRNGGTSTDIRPHILNIIQRSPTPPGWQQTVSIQQRVGIIHQMVTGLRLVKPDMTLEYAISVATQFEINEFTTGVNQEAYNNNWRQKLEEIRKTRQNQANMMQQQIRATQAGQMTLTPQQMQAQQMQAMNNPNQFKQNFGVPQAMQPGQALGAPMQQQLSQNQRLMQHGNLPDMQQSMQNGQPMQSVPRPGPPNRPQFTPEEMQQIHVIFNQMMSGMTEPERLNIQARLSNLPPAQRQQMQASGVDPMQAFVRNQATQALLNSRARKAQLAGQGFPNPGSVPIPEARPTSQISSVRGQQPHPSSTPNHPDSSFAGNNLDQILSQQRENALRHQAAGQDVVPASNIQGAPPQLRGTPQQPIQGQFGPNRPMASANPFQPQPQPQNQWNGVQTPQQNVSQTPQGRQPPTTNFASMQGQTAQQSNLQGQLGGLNNGRAQRTSQQGHNMPTLNQPMDPPAQAKNEASQKPPPQTPKQKQNNATNGQATAVNNTQSNPSQQNPQVPTPLGPQWRTLPAPFQEQLARLPNEEARKQWVIRKRQQQQMKAAQDAQTMAMSQGGPQKGIQGANPGPRFPQVSNPQALSTGNPATSQPNGNPFVAPNMQSQGSQQEPKDSNRPPQAKMMPGSLNEAQTQYMDNIPFPPNILNRTNSLGQLPDSVKSWHQLKQYIQYRGQHLPPGSMQNVIGLQSIHFQGLQKNSQIAQAHKQAQLNQTGAAPQAPMIPQPSQTLGQNGITPGPFSIPSLPQPTPQEIQAARRTLPPQYAQISDDQLRQMIMQRRQKDAMAGQQRLESQQQMQGATLLQGQMSQQQRKDLAGQVPPSQPHQTPRGPNQPAQSNQQQQPQPNAKQPPQPPGQQIKPGQAGRAGDQGNASQIGQKVAKGDNNEDVYEVPPPRMTSQPIHHRKAQPSQPAPSNGLPSMTREEFSKLTPQQKANVLRMQQATNAQRAGNVVQNGQVASGQTSAVPPSQGNNQIVEQEARMRPLIEEVERTLPQRSVVPMSPDTRNKMIEKLKDKTASYVDKLQKSLPLYLGLIKDEEQTKVMIRMRMILLQQVKDPSFNQPVDNFTMSLEELTSFKEEMHKYFAFMMKTFQSGAANNKAKAVQMAQMAQMGQSGQPAQAVQSTPTQPQKLNAENLQQHQAAYNAQRVAEHKHQANQGNKAPAAPTTSVAPWSLGEHSPQGVPIIYADTKPSMTRDDLRLPPGKKRKPNQAASAASTPAEVKNMPATKASPLTKVDSPNMQRAPVLPTLMKCPVVNCQSSGKGFATKEELDKHRVNAHEPKEPVIKDPLDAAAYAIESLRLVLNLDGNGNLKTVAQTTKEDTAAPVMKTTASSQGQNAVKKEAATPMSRNPTQTGPSPSANLLRTPQAGAGMKTPASEGKSTVKDTVSAANKASAATQSSAALAADPWADSHVRPEWFQEVFSDVGSLNRPVPQEVITGWLERNPITPPTSPSSGGEDKDSPHESDISANDNLNINVVADDWLQVDWLDNNGLPGDMDALDVGDLMDMEWDPIPEDQGDEGLGKGKRRRDPLDPSDEWLRVWAPEKLEERKKREQLQRKK